MSDFGLTFSAFGEFFCSFEHNCRSDVLLPCGIPTDLCEEVTPTRQIDCVFTMFVVTSDVLDHKWRASLKTILLLYFDF